MIVEGLLPVVHQYALDSGCGVLLVEQHIQLALEIGPGRALPRRDRPPRRAEVLHADRELRISSYLGEQRAPVGEGATGG